MDDVFFTPTTDLKNWSSVYGSELNRAKLMLADQKYDAEDIKYNHGPEPEVIEKLRRGETFIDDANWLTVHQLADAWDTLQFAKLSFKESVLCPKFSNYLVKFANMVIEQQEEPVYVDVFTLAKQILLGDELNLLLLFKEYERSCKEHPIG